MKYVLIALALLSSTVFAKDVSVDGYMRKDGTYVQPSHRSAPDNIQHNNYSSQGNMNPYTGQQGTVQPQPNYQPYNPQPTNRGASSICPYGQRC